MKKILLFISLLFIFTLNVKADSTLVIKGYKTIGVNTTSELDAIINDEIACTNYAKWESSNENVATVDNSGIVTGLQLGKSTISAKCLNSSSLSVIKGDVNYDGVLNHKDITRIGKYLSNIEEFSQAQLLVGDVNGDNIVDSTDSDLINDNTGENAPGGESPLGTIDLQHNTNGIALYFDSYTTDQDLETVSYDIEVVDSIKSVSIDDVIATFKSTDFYTRYNSNGSTFDIELVGNELVITYSDDEENYIFRYGYSNGIISYNTDDSYDQEGIYNLANAVILGQLEEAILLSAGYTQDYIDSIDISKASIGRNGILFKFEEDGEGYLIGDRFSFYADLGHIYLSDDLKYDVTNTNHNYVDFESAIESKEVTTKTKQEAVDNPKTGISLPVVGLGAMLLIAAGSIYYTNKKKAFIKF